MHMRFFAAALFVATSLSGQVENRISRGNACTCDAEKPDTLKLRQCSLCAEAEKHAAEEIFFVKDANPRKANRTLALPREHGPHAHELHVLTAVRRTQLFKAAFAKGTELWGDSWGIAYNGSDVRTQCHTHLHIGKFMAAAESNRNVILVSRAEDIPVRPGEGLWIHPVGNRFHVHVGEQITETVLLR